jgi:hypothetical protein
MYYIFVNYVCFYLNCVVKGFSYCLWGQLSPKGVVTMKKSSISQIAILCGLALGVMALWASAAPIGVSGDQIIGGWYSYWTGNGWIGCIGTDCDPCSGITSRYCSEGPQDSGGWACSGGSFYAAIAAGSGSTPHAVGGVGVCDGDPEIELSVWFCEDALHNATCN